jgi:hypothetical protein
MEKDMAVNPLRGGWYEFWSGIGNDLPIVLLTGLPTVWVFLRRIERHHKEHMTLLKKHHDEVMYNKKQP